MIYGTAVFRHRKDFGWMPIDWIPYQPAQLGGQQVLVIRDVNDRPALLRLTGLYYKAPRLGQFCKRPHELALLLPKLNARQIANSSMFVNRLHFNQCCLTALARDRSQRTAQNEMSIDAVACLDQLAIEKQISNLSRVEDFRPGDPMKRRVGIDFAHLDVGDEVFVVHPNACHEVSHG